jgi:hypothetical protein
MAVIKALLKTVLLTYTSIEDIRHSLIIDIVKKLVGNDRVPKITGMLIELPVEQMKQYMCSYENLCCKVKEADDLINQSEKQ